MKKLRNKLAILALVLAFAIPSIACDEGNIGKCPVGYAMRNNVCYNITVSPITQPNPVSGLFWELFGTNK
jgi:hypothetical protein